MSLFDSCQLLPGHSLFGCGCHLVVVGEGGGDVLLFLSLFCWGMVAVVVAVAVAVAVGGSHFGGVVAAVVVVVVVVLVCWGQGGVH